jgi:SAM-dependent methyltransferase
MKREARKCWRCSSSNQHASSQEPTADHSTLTAFISRRMPNLRTRNLPFFPGGQLYVVKHIQACKGGDVLDLGTGTGCFAIAAARKRSNVIAIDICDYLLRIARKAALEARVASQIRFVHGDLFLPLNGCRFDVVVSNPPFVPMPRACKVVSHSYGGSDGLLFVDKILDLAPLYIRENGYLQMLVLSVGDMEKPLVYDRICTFAQLRNAHVSLTRLYSSPLPLEPFVEEYRDVLGWAGWRDYVMSLGTHLHYLFCEAHCDAGTRVIWATVKQAEKELYWLNWECWKQRFVWKPASALAGKARALHANSTSCIREPRKCPSGRSAVPSRLAL